MAIHLMDMVIFRQIFGSDEAKAIFDEMGVVESWLMFEGALADVQAELGIIPKEAGEEIVRKAKVENLSLDKIAHYFKETSLVSVALIKALKDICSKDTGEYLHYGPTTQDLYDTSLAIRLSRFMPLLISDLKIVRDLLLSLSETHKKTLMIGRTHGRQAIPITFGFKLAISAEIFHDHIKRALEIYPKITVGSLSGAVGSFASFKAISEIDPLKIERMVMDKLGLNTPVIPAQPSIERFCEFLNFVALISVSVEKLVQDIFTLQRDEIGELRESSTKDTSISSSTMPHKQNPKGCEFIMGLTKLIRSNARALMEAPMRDERDRSSFWVEDIAVPEACILTSTTLKTLKEMLANLEVFQDVMRNNVGLSKGLIMTENLMIRLSKKTGRKESAHALISKLASKSVEEDIPFRDIVLNDEEVNKHLSIQEINDSFDPDKYTGLSERMTEKVLRSCGRTTEE